MKPLKILTLLIAVLAITACSTRIADLTVASTKNINLNSGNLMTGERVTGTSNVPIIIIPWGRPNLKEAIDQAIEKNDCAVGLANTAIYYNEYAFLFGYMGISVKGNLIIDRNQPGCGG